MTRQVRASWVAALVLAAGCATASRGPSPAPAPVVAAAPVTPAPPAAAVVTEPEPTAPPDPDLVYYLQTAPDLRAQDGGKLGSVDFRRLRRGSMLNHGGTTGDERIERRLDEAIASRDEKAILDATAAVLEDDAAHIRAHVVRDNLLRKHGKPRDAEFHRAMVTGLLSSIFASGDGKSTRTAFHVFHVREEYDLLRLIQAEVVSQSLDTQGGVAYDVVRVKRPDGHVAEMYFDVSELFALSTKSLGGG
jgi:hypothetical protein